MAADMEFDDCMAKRCSATAVNELRATLIVAHHRDNQVIVNQLE
jgi:hypothetical protein